MTFGLNPKIEYRNPYCFQGVSRKQIQNSNIKFSKHYSISRCTVLLPNEEYNLPNSGVSDFEFWSFEIVSNFVLRISKLSRYFTPKTFS